MSYFNSKSEDSELTIYSFAKQIGLKKSLLWSWIQEIDNKSTLEDMKMNDFTHFMSIKDEKNVSNLPSEEEDTIDVPEYEVKIENTEKFPMDHKNNNNTSNEMKEKYNCYICKIGFFQSTK